MGLYNEGVLSYNENCRLYKYFLKSNLGQCYQALIETKGIYTESDMKIFIMGVEPCPNVYYTLFKQIKSS
jgi:hypothetical protein